MLGMLLIGALAPVSVFGPIDAVSGGAVALVYIVACIAMGFTAASYAQMARVVPKAGSVFAYASTGIGPRTGFIAGWMILLDYILIPGLCYLVTGLAMNSFIPSIPVWVFTAAALVITTGLNLVGAKVASQAGAAVIVAEAVILLVIVVGAIHFLGTKGATRAALSPLTGAGGGLDIMSVLHGVSIAVLSFLGFDAITAFAEENAGTPSVVSKATLTCLVIVGAAFVVQTYLGALINPVTPGQLTADAALQGATYYSAVQTSISSWVATALGVVKAVGAAFAAMVGMAAGSRLIYGMSTDGRLPRALGVISARTRTPVKATLLSAAITIAIALPASLFADGLSVLASLVNMGALSAFLLLHISVFAYFRRKGAFRLVPHLVVPLAGGLVTAAILASSSRYAQLIGLGWLLVGLVVLAIQGLRPVVAAPSGEA
ncbi:APC family permease [Sphaerisporangium sp. NPDC051017]|uniref:APC family permease n=1 Tax=Sphaerisporangium sp. NPDC051017 TaxID=3154636 RepID=UPI00342306DA